jgi:hypothetical protein
MKVLEKAGTVRSKVVLNSISIKKIQFICQTVLQLRMLCLPENKFLALRFDVFIVEIVRFF